MKLNTCYNEDCLITMKQMPDNFISAIITDPPYGISFMNKKWDYNIPSIEIWKECLRILKPGGHILVFCGTRTQHRMAVNIEDAGYEIRDIIAWVYGEGFPKSHNIGKKNQDFKGYGSNLKPAMELITLARKPLTEKTIAKNCLKYGTGGLNINGCRVGNEIVEQGRKNSKECKSNSFGKGLLGNEGGYKQGRFPANFIHDGSQLVLNLFPNVKGPWGKNSKDKKTENSIFNMGGVNSQNELRGKEQGSAARFFYCPKTSKKERTPVNNHPTVKPIKLLQYLIKLITPPNQFEPIIYDPFAGSGSTLIAAKQLNINYIGSEINANYHNITNIRLKLL